MSTPDYIPPTDEGFRTWAEHFASHLSADPATYMLTPPQAASVQAVVDDYVAKLSVATDEATRTKASIILKDDAKEVATQLCRQYAMLIKENSGISDDDKVNIGVRPINPNREPIDPPTTFPLLSILGNTPGCQTLRYSDSYTPDSAAKPFGATGMQLYVAVTDAEAAPLSEALFQGMHTRNPVAVEFSEPDDGKVATYYARWINAKGEHGPWSLPVSMRIAA